MSEIRYLASGAVEGSDLAALKSHPALGDGDWTTRRLRSVYFDTEDLGLARLAHPVLPNPTVRPIRVPDAPAATPEQATG
jgi:hypothetical protein